MGWLLLALGFLAGGGCGESYDLPALAATEAPRIRVLLGGRRRTEAALRLTGQSWSVESERGAPFSRQGRTDVNARVSAGRSGVAIAGQDTGAQVLRIRAEREFELEGTRYAGDLLLVHDGDGIRFVNELDLETYVAGVIGNEMAPGAPPAAYRAQAVAARTYGWIRLHESGAADQPWHVTDDQGSQVYAGLDPRYDAPYEQMLDHVRRTAGVILTWQTRPFPAYYSSTCGGHTTDPPTSRLDPAGATSPLRGVRCDFCKASPRYAWSKVVTDAQIVAGFKARGRPIVPPVHAIRVSRPGPGGWAAEVEVLYGPQRKSRTLPGPDFRSALGLDSHLLTQLERRGDAWFVAGHGWGHGVGMCQWGAMEMARRGSTESEILSWYYPGAAFTRVY